MSDLTDFQRRVYEPEIKRLKEKVEALEAERDGWRDLANCYREALLGALRDVNQAREKLLELRKTWSPYPPFEHPNVQAALDGATATVANSSERFMAAEVERDQANKDRDRLAEALRAYGNHRIGCSAMNSVGEWSQPGACSCGFDAALEDVPGGGQVNEEYIKSLKDLLAKAHVNHVHTVEERANYPASCEICVVLASESPVNRCVCNSQTLCLSHGCQGECRTK